ncbi:hypothetical protein DIPPA_31220 [Diplonema papillatum]|nr:hypothetical protein DIPPA_31220 [Diplonema papillatum]
MGILETQLKASRHAFTGEAWGMDLFPTYGRERAERAARWAAFDDATEKRKGKKSEGIRGSCRKGFPDTKSGVSGCAPGTKR